MISREIRDKFLEFFTEKGHTVISSASLIPSETDPTVLFTTAGMHPLVPYLLGEKHPGGNKIANVQKCIRTVDIDEVGDISHLTFFEMLGNWSFGSYFKKEAIEWSWKFLTAPNWLGLDPDKIAVSVFQGDDNAPFDEESYEIWEKTGLSKKRIAKLPKENNWWDSPGATGPCGPDTEMFYWMGNSEKAPETFDPNDNNWLEIWNDVFMQYNKIAEGRYEPLKQKNVDTGMGLERIAMVMQDVSTVYETDLFLPIMRKIDELGHLMSNGTSDVLRSKRIIADHIKAAVFIISDEVEPSNTGRGYVLRRLIRRAIRHGKLLGIEKFFINKIAESVIDIYKEQYPELLNNELEIMNELEKEDEKFRKTLDQGIKEFNKLKEITGKDAFNLYQTYGFPFEMTKEIATEKGIEINETEFKEEFNLHQELSKTASVGMFKGGLADSGEQSKKYHTATHLLLSALRHILGNHVEQKGSNIDSERMRFDFSHSQKMTEEEIKKVEDIVNEKIKENLPVSCEEMNLEEAKQKGALGSFEQKYLACRQADGDKVKVYSIGSFSKEICGGPHVENTGEIGDFKIIKEEASSAGVRRIKAIVENS
ncbi:alanine--tRNA ligase [Patescibacteria group bacterium]|nr:alanine--tRNA ligase [Patescibacteria group bacterium]